MVILEELKCHSNPCQNGGTCFENSGGYTCTCPPGYKGINCAGKKNFTCRAKIKSEQTLKKLLQPLKKLLVNKKPK